MMNEQLTESEHTFECATELLEVEKESDADKLEKIKQEVYHIYKHLSERQDKVLSKIKNRKSK